MDESAESPHQLELFWDSTWAIAISLLEYHPARNPEQLGIEELAQLVERLPGFADEPSFATERMLLDIQTTWYEEKHQ